MDGMNGVMMTWLHQLGTLEFWETLLDSFGDLGPLEQYCHSRFLLQMMHGVVHLY